MRRVQAETKAGNQRICLVSASRTTTDASMRGMHYLANTDDVAAVVACLSIFLACQEVLRRTSIIRESRRRRPKQNSTPSVRCQHRLFHEATRYLNEFQFARTFRVLRRIFHELLDLIRADLEREDRQARRSSGGRVEPAVRLAVTLRLLAGASYLDLVTNCHIAPATVYAIFHDTVRHLCIRIAMPDISLQDEAGLQRLAEGFQTSIRCSDVSTVSVFVS